MIRTPQRIYNRRAVEQWFERLNVDWEKCFRADELMVGRRLYREGTIVSSEVTEECVIVTFRDGKEEIYSVIEWRNEQPEVRVSTHRIQPVRALAVAGMYELEEMITDLLPPLPGEGVEQDTHQTDTASGDRPSEPQPSREPARPLQIQLKAAENGLILRAFWKNESDTRSTTAALPSTPRNEAEREQIIRLTSLLHRAGFRQRPKAHGFMLSNPSAVLSFLRDEWPRWAKKFELDTDPNLKSWLRGLQTIKLRMRIEGDQDAVQIHWASDRIRDHLAPETLSALTQHPGQTHFIPGQGVYRLDPRQIDTVTEWKVVTDAFRGNQLPPYLIFRFISDPHIRIDLDTPLEGWIQQLNKGKSRRLSHPDYLRDYQKQGIEWMNRVLDADCHPLLADEMGLGKTLQTLCLLKSRKALEDGLVLVVCPASVVPVWQEEIQRFFPEMPTEVLRADSLPSADRPGMIWLASYTQLRRNRKVLDSIDFAYALLDEAQFIKNPDAKTTQACLSLKAHHRIALTGTPVENRPQDLWTLFRFLMPGLLDNRRRLSDRFKANADEALAHLRSQLKPFVLRRSKKAVAKDLPEKMDVVLPCSLTPMQETLYQQLAAQGLSELKNPDEASSRMHVFALLTRLRQACCDPSLLPGVRAGTDQSGKLRVLLERLEEAIESGAKVIVFSQFVRFLARARELLEERFPDLPLFELTGQTTDRSKPVAGFRKAKGSACFLISLRAGGTGLNLQSADYVFLLDPWWNPAVEAQAVDRVHRLGRKNRVFIYRLIAQGTIEERIERLKSDKSALFEQLLSDASQGLQLSDHLHELEEWIRYQSPSQQAVHS